MTVKELIRVIDKWLEPKCDLCGKPGRLYSDGVGMIAHKKCWNE